MSSDLHYQSLTSVSDLIRRRKLSPVEATRAILERIARLDGQYRSYVTVLADRALERAKAAEAEIARGLWRGPLHGVPVAVKDLCNTTFAPTTSGTTIFKDFIPSFNATVVDRLEQSGAVIVGKLRMTEGAYTSHHPQQPAPLNPWNTGYWVGSSSTGSGSRYVSRALLRQPWHGHRRLDTLPLRHLRPDGDQADLGTGEPTWRVSARRIARSCGPDDAQRRRLRRHSRRDRRLRRE